MKYFSVFSRVLFPVRTLAIAFVLTSLVSACMKPGARSPDPNADFSDPTKSGANQSAATFVNSEVTGGSSVSMNMPGYSVPTERLFNFVTCVQDKRTQENIKGHKFNIIGAPGAVVMGNNGRSDDKGCVYWSEKLAYNGAGDAKFLPIKRTLVADGMHTGARELNICINPWDPSATGSDSIKDCGRKAIPEEQLAKPEEIPYLLNAQNKAGEKLDRHLWINDMRINSTHNPGGTQFGLIDFSVSMGPKILRHNVRGEEDPLSLSDGLFGMEFWIIAKTGEGNKCYVIAKSGLHDSLRMIGGRLQNEMKMKVHYLSTYGQLELVGAIQPRDNSLNVRMFNGIWMLGDHSGLLGMKFGFERPATYKGEPGSFDARKYAASCDDVSGDALMESRAVPKVPAILPRTSGIPGATTAADGRTTVARDLMANECVDAADIPRLFPLDAFARDFRSSNDLLSCINKNLPSGIARLEQFEFGLVIVKPEPIVDPIETETTTERTIKYSVTTLVKNPITDQRLRDMEFTVHKSDGSIDRVRTNADGLLIYTDKIHHIYFEPERYMLKLTQITHSSGFSKHLAIVFNPWDNNGFTFARDLRMLTKQTVAQVNLVPRPKSELLVTQFQWGTQGFRYEVDDYLNLKIYKQFNLTLTPRVLRYSSLTEGRMKDEPLRNGIYLMKVAIQKDYRPIDGEALEFVTAIRKLVRVVSGQIVTPVEMAFRDFRVLKLRTNLMVEIATIDEAKLSRAQRKTLDFDGPIDSLEEKSSGLRARTFIGPVVAYSNGFSSSMRPADDLSESFCKTIDCDELKKNDRIPPSELTEESKFFGSIRHLANKTVTSMIARMEVLDAKYRAKMTATAKLSHLLKDENFEFGAVFNESAILGQDTALQKNNTVLKTGNGFADLVKRMSSIDGLSSFSSVPAEQVSQNFKRFVPKRELDVAGFKDVLFGNKPLTQEIAARLCVVFIEDIILQSSEKTEAALPYGDRVRSRVSRMLLNDECMRSLQRSIGGNSQDPIISLERKLRVFQLADVVRRGGNLMSLSVGAGSAYSMSRSQSLTFGWSPTSTVSGVLKGVGLGAAEKFLDVFGIGVNLSRSDSKSISQDTSVDTKQNLAVELRGMRLTLGQYERCASIRLAQSFIEEQFLVLNRALPQSLPLLDRINRMRRGIFLCEGMVSKTPIEVDERYYQFSQMIGDEVMNDPTALENHPYLITTLRSRPDFARMVQMIEARPKSLGDLPNHVNIGEVPIQRLMSVFKSPVPSFPGILTIEPDTIVQAPVLHKIEEKK